MANLTSIRAGIAANIQTARPNIEVYSFIRDQIIVPCAMVGMPDTVEFDTTIARGSDRWTIPVRVYVSRADDETSQEALDDYLDSNAADGIKAAIESDITLDGAASTLRVMEASNFGEYVIGNTSYLGVEFVVEVITQ